MLSDTRERGMQIGQADLLRAMQYLPVGMSIIDRDLQFRFWNETFCQCLDFPDSLMQPGVLLEDLFRFNALRGNSGPAILRPRCASASTWPASSCRTASGARAPMARSCK